MVETLSTNQLLLTNQEIANKMFYLRTTVDKGDLGDNMQHLIQVLTGFGELGPEFEPSTHPTVKLFSKDFWVRLKLQSPNTLLDHNSLYAKAKEVDLFASVFGEEVAKEIYAYMDEK